MKSFGQALANGGAPEGRGDISSLIVVPDGSGFSWSSAAALRALADAVGARG